LDFFFQRFLPFFGFFFEKHDFLENHEISKKMKMKKC
jgi:hypothetical protein